MESFLRSRAILIGIDAYGPGIPQLHSAVNDVRELAELLQTGHGYDATTLLDEAATLQGLRAMLKGLREGPDALGPDDRLLLYFAGHGMAVNSDDGPAGYLVPQDARLLAVDQPDIHSLLPMRELVESLKGITCRHLLLTLDCCFAGAIRWAATRDMSQQRVPLYQVRLDTFVRLPVREVLTSTSADQRALDMAFGERGSDEQGHSPFAASLLKGLRGDADFPFGDQPRDGVITVGELYAYIESTLDNRQRPCLIALQHNDSTMRDNDGEYVFLVPGQVPHLPATPELNLDNNPYRGLKPYAYDPARPADDYLFYGRKASIDALCERVKGQLFTVVLGPSGSGKSSLVAAGLLPRLEADGWTILGPLRPGSDPVRALE